MSLDSRNRKCLVIGGGGYIGSFIVPLLLASERSVTVLGRREAGRSLPAGVRYVRGCFSDLPLISGLLDEHHEVIHLAYATVPNTSFDNPLGDLLENLPPTVQLFAEAAARGNRLVFVSSGGTVYGEAETLPITEDHPTRPISPYGVTKLTLERYAHLYRVTRGLQVICIRPGNAYGEGQRPFMGQGFVATAMASAILGRPVTVFGQRGGLRDYIHVADLASGMLAALDKGRPGQTYNLGSGVGRSSVEVLERMTPLLAERGYGMEVVTQAARPFDVRANVLDSTALKSQTNWAAKVDFDSGLARALDWLDAHLRELELRKGRVPTAPI